MCLYQLLRSYKDTKKTRVRLDRNLAPCRRSITNFIGSLHECKKWYPCAKALLLSGIRAWIKEGWRKGENREQKEKGQETDKMKGI